MADVEHYQHHSARRAKTPSDEDAARMSDEAKRPERYSPPIRTRSGPVLAWDRGDNLDDIATDATPLYRQERIHPAAFVEQLRQRAPGEPPEQQRFDSFADFNNFPADAQFRWYEHEGNWSNRLIRGDSVRVMASLLAKEGMAGKVQMIYMDPPYGINFKSNLQTAVDNRNTPANKNALPSDPTVVQTFRDTYDNGIHSYLDNLYRNFVYARELLSESGSIFVQIGSENVGRVMVLLDEIFGAQNRVAQICFNKGGIRTSRTLPQVGDYILWYSRSLDAVKFRPLCEEIDRAEVIEMMSSYALLELNDGSTRKLTQKERDNFDLIPESSRIFQSMQVVSSHHSSTGRSEPYEWMGRTYRPRRGAQWSVSHTGMDRLADLNRLYAAPEGNLRWKWYEDEVPGRWVNNLWSRQMSATDLHYIVETATSVIERCILMATDPGDLVIDITGGGG